MKTFKLIALILTVFILSQCEISLSNNRPEGWYFGNDPYEYKIPDMNGCNCDCDACRECRYKSPDKEIGYYDYNIMTNRDFSEFKQLIADRPFESTKMDMTKSVADINYFSTDQVKEMLSWFSFESSKLELAKYVFKNTVDRNNYYKLFKSFDFESSVTDLADYIKNYR
jgi:hypothetical protein